MSLCALCPCVKFLWLWASMSVRLQCVYNYDHAKLDGVFLRHHHLPPQLHHVHLPLICSKALVSQASPESQMADSGVIVIKNREFSSVQSLSHV